MNPIPVNPVLRRATLVFLFAGFCLEARAGAWAVRPGAGKAVVSASYLDAGSVTDAEGGKHSFAISERSLSTYGEIGITRSLAAGWSWTGLKWVESDAFEGVSPADPEISLSWHLRSVEAWQFAAQTMAVFPLGSENPGDSPDYLYGVYTHRAFALEVRPVAGWAGGGIWVQGGAGPRVRSNDLSAQFHYNLAGGGSLGRRIGWLLAFSGITPFDTDPAGKPGDQERYFGYQVAGEYRFNTLWQAGAQFDSMFTLGQEMPLGARLNAFIRFAWTRALTQ